MTIVCLYDAVTLRHFGTIERIKSSLPGACTSIDRTGPKRFTTK